MILIQIKISKQREVKALLSVWAWDKLFRSTSMSRFKMMFNKFFHQQNNNKIKFKIIFNTKIEIIKNNYRLVRMAMNNRMKMINIKAYIINWRNRMMIKKLKSKNNWNWIWKKWILNIKSSSTIIQTKQFKNEE